MSYVKNTQDWEKLEIISKSSEKLHNQKNLYKNQFNLVDDQIEEIKETIVYEFSVEHSDDLEILIAEPIWKWQQTDLGKWVMEKSIEPPKWIKYSNSNLFLVNVVIKAKFKERDYTYWCLKWKV